jgi:hypothetical protein
MYFLVSENLVSKYEQLLIFMDIDSFSLIQLLLPSQVTHLLTVEKEMKSSLTSKHSSI